MRLLIWPSWKEKGQMGSESSIEASVNKLKILGEMSCEKRLTWTGCKNCEYYYETEHKTIACLKQNLRRWVLYRIDKQHGN